MRTILCLPILATLLAAAACDRLPTSSFGDSQTISADALRAASADEGVRQFYKLRGEKTAWTREMRDQLEQVIGDALRHALDPKDFAIPEKQADSVARDVELTKTALHYAHALAAGVVDPKRFWKIYTVPSQRSDLVRGLNEAIASGDLKGWFASLAPSDPEYQALSAAYLEYRQRAAQSPSVSVPPGRPIKPGMRDPRVPAIVAALRIQGYFGATPAESTAADPAKPVDPTRYTRATAAAVSLLQADYGIKSDGIVSDDTLEALNTGPKDRARILAVNLERRRWLERQPAATRIDVNTAAAFLEYWREGSRVDARRVVVGQPDWETPQLGSPLRRLVANPPWRVPDKIAEKEILPKGAGYMARNDMHYENGRIVQAGGPKSALGLVKLDLDNPHAIYLHDTPAKAFFAQEERHASHGCVRVQNAVDFARMIAGDENALPAFEEALASGKEADVALAKPIPVRLLYHSAYLDNGRIVFRPDPYGWDDQLAQALGLGTQVRQRVKPLEADDVGP